MCLIVFSYKERADYPLIFAGNRDEFHGRPSAPARFWIDHPHVLAGRDLKAGGTWLGVTRNGRFATVTNYREPDDGSTGFRSRGELVTRFLLGSDSPESYIADLERRGSDYKGFNLILGAAGSLYYCSNRSSRDTGGAAAGEQKQYDAAAVLHQSEDAAVGPRIRPIEAGLHGLSNEQLDTPWPKVRRAKALFREAVGEHEPTPDSLLELLADTHQASVDQISSSGLDTESERALSSIFIKGDVYGTRASTVVLVRNDGLVVFAERTFGPGGEISGTELFEYTVDSIVPDAHV